MLQDGTGLVLFDTFGHHIENIVHDGRSELQIKVGLDTLLRHSFGDALRVATFELTGQQVAQPAFKQRGDAAQEKEPHAPSWSPNAASRTLSNRTGVEAVVNEVLEILAHTDLPHQLVLVTVHAGQLTDVGENVLKAISQLEGIDVVETVLDVGVDDQLRQTQNFTAEMESISETRFFTLLGR